MSPSSHRLPSLDSSGLYTPGKEQVRGSLSTGRHHRGEGTVIRGNETFFSHACPASLEPPGFLDPGGRTAPPLVPASAASQETPTAARCSSLGARPRAAAGAESRSHPPCSPSGARGPPWLAGGSRESEPFPAPGPGRQVWRPLPPPVLRVSRDSGGPREGSSHLHSRAGLPGGFPEGLKPQSPSFSKGYQLAAATILSNIPA